MPRLSLIHIFSDKYDLTKHPNYKHTADADKKYLFDMERYMKRKPAIVKPDEPFEMCIRDRFKDDYEKIFISHREADKDQVDAFVDLLHAIGIPRPTIEAPESVIFCTSHPEGYIENGKRNLDEIRDRINTDEHVLYILWYTDKYFESPACLNEAGAIWAMKKKYQEILMPDFDSSQIRGLLDKQPVWFRANDKMRLNTFKEQIEKMFALPPTIANTWELSRDKFIEQINKIASQKEELCEQ